MAPPRPRASHHRPTQPAERTRACTDLGLLALTLIATWSVRTGRHLRAVSVDDLSPDELIEFWADDQLEPPYAAPSPRRLW
ncbi:hypothetical protein GCM10010191_59340 [Actinomadura vinacea]|uniref:Uncharacterized protein n=1 Tax=Actinomadura vinacea TaxID=115336 RepID=A0ABP5WUV1_9ACTN